MTVWKLQMRTKALCKCTTTAFVALSMLALLFYISSQYENEETLPTSPTEDLMDTSLPTAISANGTFTFHSFASSEPFIAVSAFWRIGGKSVRVFLMKHINIKPKIYCSFSNDDFQPTKWTVANDCHGGSSLFQEWNEFVATVRGFSICCDNEEGKDYPFLRLSAVLPRSTLGTNLVELPIERSLPVLSKIHGFPYKFGLCLPPMFNIERFTPKFLVEFIELHRALGADLIIIYIFDKPSPDVKRLLESYRDEYIPGQRGKFRIILIYWHLPANIDPETTWSKTQIIAQNDCLYRFGRYAKYLVFSDFDEVVMPNAKFGYSWSNMVEGHKFSVACSCQIMFWFDPQNGHTKESVYYAQRTTLHKNGCGPKCIIRSGLAYLFHVHEPLEPMLHYNASELFTLHHYQYCYGDCEPDARQVSINQQIWPLRERLQSIIDDRLSRIFPTV